LEFQKPLEKETEKEEFLVNHRDLIIKKSLTAEYEKNYARSLEKSHTAENKRDWIFTLSFVVPSYSLPKFAPFFLFLFVKNNPSKPVFDTANSLIELTNDTKKMAERLRIYPFGLSAQKQINDFLAEPERDDIQKNVLVSEPVESITLQKREEKKLLMPNMKIWWKMEIFIFDEADNALDEKNKKEFRQKIEKISKKRLEYLQEIEDPHNNQEVNYALPENPSPLQVAKFRLCKKILGYKLDNNLTREQIAEKIGISKAETEDILFSHIEEFTLDRLITYAGKLLDPAEVNVTVEQKKSDLHA
ncbi:10469_t:CDS:2, partial [Racocetra persica]